MSAPAPDSDLRALLAEASTWVIVGLGTDPDRPAHEVASFLQQQGKRIVPVHPRAREVLGEPGFATVGDAVAALADEGTPVDIVDCFVASNRVGAVVDQAVAAGVPAVWLQLRIDDAEAVERARAAGVTVVVDRCPTLEWSRLGPRRPDSSN